MTSAAIDLVGHEVLGTYELLEVLGRGGMAVVYRGRHVLTDQTVAVKVLPPELASNAEVKTRFIEEARTLARLEHPNIVLLHNFQEEGGHLFLVMQFAEGETFDRIIERKGRVGAADVVQVGIETLRALQYAHEQQVIHRDIKPSNIIIRSDGTVKVMDFGIAKIVGSSKLTQTGQTMGTVRYMSPEQVRGKTVDQRSDLYSLGVTLYEACAGRTPFDGDTHFEIMRKHLSELPTPLGQLADIPEQLERAVMRALSKRSEERYQEASSFRAALEAVPVKSGDRQETSGSLPAVDDPVARVSEPRVRERRGVGWQIALAAALLIIAGAGVLWALLSGPDRATKKKAAAPEVTQEDRGKAETSAPSWPELHPAARATKWTIDKRLQGAKLRVLASAPVDVAAIGKLYRGAREAYEALLREEHVPYAVKLRPLNLVLMPPRLFARQPGWHSPRYNAPTSTLFIRRAGDYLATDIPYGVALHFCALELSPERCLQLAERFEKSYRKKRR